MTRRSNTKKILSLILSILIIVAALYLINYTDNKLNNEVSVQSGDKLYVHFIDVGQGDCIFIDYNDYDILIDGGDNNAGQTVVNYLEELNTDDIEIMIATHNHADHVGGLDDVLEAFDVETIIDSGDLGKSKTYKDYLEAAKAENCEFIEDDDMTFDIDEDIKLKIIETGDNYKNTNDNSVIALLDYNNIEMLFTGDMEEKAELKALNKFCDVEVLKVGHHGSRTATSDSFLNVVKPEYAVISCGTDNRYGHPHKETLEKLNKNNIQIFRTDTQGNIVAETDGKTVSFSCEKK